VTAVSGNGGYACFATRVAVSDTGLQGCRLSVYQSTIVDGSSSTITLNYYNLPSYNYNYYNQYYYNQYYSQYGLIDSFNLLVNLVSGGSVRLEPVVTDTLQVVATRWGILSRQLHTPTLPLTHVPVGYS